MDLKSGMLLTLRRCGTTTPSSLSLAEALFSSNGVSLSFPAAPLLLWFLRHWCEDRPMEKALLLRWWLQTMARARRDLSLNVKSSCGSSRQSHSTRRKSHGTSVTSGSNSVTNFLSLCRTQEQGGCRGHEMSAYSRTRMKIHLIHAYNRSCLM